MAAPAAQQRPGLSRGLLPSALLPALLPTRLLLLLLLLPPVVVAVAASSGGAGCSSPDACGIDGPLGEEPSAATAAALGLLQRESGRHHSSAPAAREARDLVLGHIPFNFGATAEMIAAYGNGPDAVNKFRVMQGTVDYFNDTQMQWNFVQETFRQDAEVWGHLNPDLQQMSEVTGCPLYYTPGKYWPTDIARSYFGNKTIFGILRDPYDRLVSMFRANYGDEYGGAYPEFVETCDANGAVRKMMNNYLAGDIYAAGCVFVPQAEYFEEPFGVTLAVDNRRLPDSLNEVFAEHGYTEFRAGKDDVLHVDGCPDVWPGDLDCETKALVKQVYARDFELLCKHFGYCDQDENSCTEGVPQMCPSNLDEKRKTATYCDGTSSE